MAENKGDELKNTEKDQHELFPTKLAQDASLIVNLLQSRIMDREPKVVAKTKANNADLEKNKNIFMNNNNIQYKYKLNPLAKSFSMPTSKRDFNDNLAMDTNSIPDNISKQITVNDVAQKSSYQKKNENLVTNSFNSPNKTILNPLAKSFSMPTSKSDFNDNLAMDTNSIPDNISKQITVNDVAQKSSYQKKNENLVTKSFNSPNKTILNPLAKSFSMPISKSDFNDNLVMDTNSIPDNISKQITVNDVAQKSSYQKKNENLVTKSFNSPNKTILNPLAKSFLMPISKSDFNDNLAMDTNSIPDNISKQITVNDVAQKDSNCEGHGCVESLSCIPPNNFTLSTLLNKCSMTIHKSDLNENLVTDLCPTSNYVPTQWKENEENFGQHSFNHIMDDPPEKPFSSKRKSNWIVRFFTYCFKKLSFKTHC